MQKTENEIDEETTDATYSDNISIEEVNRYYHSNSITFLLNSRITSLEDIKRQLKNVKLLELNEKYSYSKHKIIEYPECSIYFVYRIKSKDSSSMMVYSYFSFDKQEIHSYMCSLQEGSILDNMNIEEKKLPMIEDNGKLFIEFLNDGEIRHIELKGKNKEYTVKRVYNLPNEPNKNLSEIADNINE